MDFEFDSEQQMLRESVGGFLADEYGFEQRRSAAAGLPGWRPDIWRRFASDLGILGASFPAAAGGFDGGPVENMIVMEELGKALALEPWLETIVIAAPLIADGGTAADALARDIVAGQAIAVPLLSPSNPEGAAIGAAQSASGYELSGRVRGVRSAPIATHFLIPFRSEPSEKADQIAIVAANTPGIERSDHRAVDGSWLSEIAIDRLAVSAGDLITGGAFALERVAAARDAGLAALCAESVGIQRRLLELTVAYAKERRQFGRPIGDFQALQHRMADMFIKVEEATSMTLMATLHLAADDAECREAVLMAKIAVDQSARLLGQSAIQIHGGMGMTRELPVADYVSRLSVIGLQLGSTDDLLRQFEGLSFAA